MRRTALRRLIAATLAVAGLIALSLIFAAAVSAAAIPGQYIVVLKDGVSEPATAADHAKKGAEVSQHYRHALNGYAARLSDSQLAAVRADQRVAFVQPDEMVHATGVPCLNRGTLLNDDPSPQCLAWDVDRIDGELSSTKSGDGRGSVNVNVAVVDTGIDLEHPDLNVAGGVDCTGKGLGFDDQDGHGTHVAGTIAAKDDGIGVAGVAPGAPLWAVRVLGKNGAGSTSTIVCGIDFVTGTRFDGDPSNDIRVANMSLGGKGADDGSCGLTNKDATHVAICSSVRAGVTYAVAAGNGSADLATHVPSAYDEVLAATAMSDFDGQPGGIATVGPSTAGDPCPHAPFEDDDAAASFSNFATLASDRAHTVAAPGVCVLSTYPVGAFANCPDRGCYALEAGTSMASPHVAGTVALCIAFGPCAGLTPQQIVQKIVADAAAYNTARRNSGYGFQGDPLRPISGKYYGYLIRAGLY
jgi:subtilisin